MSGSQFCKFCEIMMLNTGHTICKGHAIFLGGREKDEEHNRRVFLSVGNKKKNRRLVGKSAYKLAYFHRATVNRELYEECFKDKKNRLSCLERYRVL